MSASSLNNLSTKVFDNPVIEQPSAKKARLTDSSRREPPRAKKERTVHAAHKDVRPDDYHWMRNVEDPAFINYLNEWNAFTEQALQPLAPFTAKLFQEMTAKIETDYETVPFRVGSYEYFSRYVDKLEYAIYCRRSIGSQDTTVILDSNILAQKMRAEDPVKYPQFSVLHYFPSPDGKYLALAIDRDGSRFGTIHILDLTTGAFLEETLPDNDGDFIWDSHSTGLWYLSVNEVKRADKAKFHRLGTNVQQNPTLFYEPNGLFVLGLKSDKLSQRIFITAKSKDTSEIWMGKLDDPTRPLQVILRRDDGFLYKVVPAGTGFYFLTTNRGENTGLYFGGDPEPLSDDDWVQIEQPSSSVDAAEIFERFIVMQKRINGLPVFEVLDLRSKQRHSIPLPQELCEIEFYKNYDFASNSVRFTFESPISPPSVYEWDMDKRQLTLLRQDKAGGFKTEDFTMKRIFATAKDGTQIPITIFNKKGLPQDGSVPMHLYGYGAYGVTTDPYFSIASASLLERGMYCAIAHIRGSGDCGYTWYESGRMLKKRNTFTDFIDCAQTLIHKGYTSADKLAIRGGSAGGLLMGAVVNMRPDLCAVCIAEVPFVDIVTTMFDTSLPLTEEEWVEWGNPNDEKYYHYMKSYSPYDNVTAQHYPSLMVTSGLHDHQVSIHEPAKWVAKLTEFSTSQNPILFKITMEAGHGGDSGRFAKYKELAARFGFMLSKLGLAMT